MKIFQFFPYIHNLLRYYKRHKRKSCLSASYVSVAITQKSFNWSAKQINSLIYIRSPQSIKLVRAQQGPRNFLQCLYPLSANPTKLSNTLKQFVGNLLTNCLSVFDHFVGLALKGLIVEFWSSLICDGSQPAFTCSKLTMATPNQCLKSVQS